MADSFIKVTNPQTGESAEATFKNHGQFISTTEELKKNSESKSPWNGLLCSFISPQLNLKDVLFPTLYNSALKIENVVLKAFAAIGAILWDTVTALVRIPASLLITPIIANSGHDLVDAINKDEALKNAPVKDASGNATGKTLGETAGSAAVLDVTAVKKTDEVVKQAGWLNKEELAEKTEVILSKEVILKTLPSGAVPAPKAEVKAPAPKAEEKTPAPEALKEKTA